MKLMRSEITWIKALTIFVFMSSVCHDGDLKSQIINHYPYLNSVPVIIDNLSLNVIKLQESSVISSKIKSPPYHIVEVLLNTANVHVSFFIVKGKVNSHF